jgi:asparagine synthetase B (glutamine-hydrolysing)
MIPTIVAVFDERGIAAAKERLRRAALPQPTTTLERGSAALVCWGPSRALEREGLQIGTDTALEDGDAAEVRLHTTHLELATSPLVGRPFFYARRDTFAIASTRLEWLLRLLPEKPSLHLGSLAAHVGGMGAGYREQTIYEGVLATGPGERLSLSPREAKKAEVACPVGEPLEGVPAEELAEMLWSELVASVERTTRGVATVGMLASGGLDSSGVLAALAHVRGGSQKELRAFNISFGGHGDDRPHVRAVCRSLGVVLVEIPPTEGAERLVPTLVQDAQPYASALVAAEVALNVRAREQGVELLLSGNGGDELLDGEPNAFASRARSAPLAAVREVRRLVGPDFEPPWERVRKHIVYPLLKPLVPEAVLAWRRRRLLRRTQPWFLRSDEVELAEAFGGGHLPVEQTPDERYRTLSRAPWLRSSARGRAQMEITTGCMRRDPLLSPAFVRFVARMPPAALFHGGMLRGLYRLALRGRIPDAVRLRTDKAASEPAFLQVVQSLGGFAALRSWFELPRLTALGLVDQEALRKEIARMERVPMDCTWSPFAAVAVEELLRQRDGWDFPRAEPPRAANGARMQREDRA